MSEPGLYASVAAGPWPGRLIAFVAMLAALVLLAVVLAHWGWRWFGPAPVALAPSRSDGELSRRIAEAHLFGTAAPSAPAKQAAAVRGDLRLLGVFAQQDGRGYALFRAGSRGALLVAAGDEAAPGVRLESVQPDGVTLIEDGERRAIDLRGTAPVEKASTASASKPVRGASCAAPPGFSGQIIRLNAELLAGMIDAPDTWKALLQPGPGGLVVRDQSGFAGMMGLRNGDHVERANGIALSLPEDVASTVLKPLTRSQPVRVAGTRDDKPQQWLYLNAGACPPGA